MLTWHTTIDKDLPINNYQPNEIKNGDEVIGRIISYDPKSGVVIYETSNSELFNKINNFGIGKMECSIFSFENTLQPKIEDVKDATEFGRQLGINNPTISVVNFQGKEEPLDLSKLKLIPKTKVEKTLELYSLNTYDRFYEETKDLEFCDFRKEYFNNSQMINASFTINGEAINRYILVDKVHKRFMSFSEETPFEIIFRYALSLAVTDNFKFKKISGLLRIILERTSVLIHGVNIVLIPEQEKPILQESRTFSENEVISLLGKYADVLGESINYGLRDDDALIEWFHNNK